MAKKVKVLLSTYNGAEFLQEQMNSILQQTHGDVDIVVRDDGSTDRTISILEAYEKAGQITLHKGQNLGFALSFFELLKVAGEADYYAFADQDDIWLDYKMAYAVKKLEKEDPQMPTLYFSD